MSIGTVFGHLYWFVAGCSILCSIVEGRPTDVDESQSYLMKYGYLSESKGGLAQGAQDMTQSLKALQRFAGLKETGQLDNETLKLIKTPRCGSKDPKFSRRKRRYVLEGTKWKKTDLTYRIVNDPYNGPTSRKHLPPELISKAVKAALQKWSFASPLTFTEKKEGEADIMIKFIRGNHNDGYNFDGRGGSLAHAFYPSTTNKGLSGDAHFDLDEKFSLTERGATNFIWVTTHEFGHSLGLQHSNIKGTIMSPWLERGSMGNVELTSDDVKGIQAIYGKPAIGLKREEKIVLPQPPRPECKMSFQAAFHDKRHKKMYAIIGRHYYVLNRNGKSEEPKRVDRHWKSTRQLVNAAYTRRDGRIVFFTKITYQIYDGTRLVEGPDFIERYGLPKALREMDAAVVFGGNGATYFFKGDLYWKYDEFRRKIYPGYPKLITRYWRGLPTNIDSALQTVDGETIFFKGTQFYKLHHNSLSVYPSYPKPIGPSWMGCQKEDYQIIDEKGGKSSSLALAASRISLLLLSIPLLTLYV